LPPLSPPRGVSPPQDAGVFGTPQAEDWLSPRPQMRPPTAGGPPKAPPQPERRIPLEVALNKVWGIQKNRSYLHNQFVSLLLIFSCGTLALLSLGITELRVGSSSGLRIEQWTSILVFKLAAVPLTSLMLFLIYRYLPNGRPPLSRVIAAAIGVGLLLEGLKYLNILIWPWVDARIQREYGVFRYSATILFLSFLASMLVLAGAEWAARGHQLKTEEKG